MNFCGKMSLLETATICRNRMHVHFSLFRDDENQGKLQMDGYGMRLDESARKSRLSIIFPE